MSRWQDAKQAITDRMKANWPYTQIVGDNERIDEKDAETAGAFAYFEIVLLPGSKIALAERGNHTVEDPGRLVLHILTPIDQGTGQGDALADLAADLWRDMTLTDTFGRLTFGTPSPPQTGVGTDDQAWWRTTVSIPFSLVYFA